MHISDVIIDLQAEQESLDRVVSTLSPADWVADTASPRWTVTDQLAHLTYFDHAAAIAVRDAELFASMADDLYAAAGGSDTAVDEFTLGAVRDLEPADRHAAWKAGRTALATAASTLADDTRVAWYGPSMGAKSFLTARLMECWAHGQDIVDAVGVERPPTDRLKHIAQLGFITRGWTYANRGLEMPGAQIRVVLAGPAGDEWTWGSEEADDLITGSAEDFCRVVTQRRHLHDTSLSARGEAALDWLLKAQTFAGPATDGPSAKASR